MSPGINRQWLFASRPVGMVSTANFKLHEAPLPEVKDGQVLVRSLYLSMDPAMRAWMWERETYIAPLQVGEVMRGSAVAQVIESKKPGYAPGDFVVGVFGWQEYAASSGGGPLPMVKIPPGVPLAATLGVLGITGLTAYFGLLDLGEPQAGQTVVVSGAAGAVGSIAGQIAKLKGCRVIGIAGGPEKCRWCVEQGQFDACIDYKHENVRARLKELCPDRINVYFDNVGGEILEAAMDRLALKARVVICGAISRYNAEAGPIGPRNYMNLLVSRARMEGFVVFDYADQFPQALAEMAGWIAEGKLRYEEDIVEGFENAPAALLRLFEGKNLGKQIVKIADPQ
ncbi:MAG: NADP-dependent oxidoreductase [Pirellulales bacterium]|nr:NADP-dependent oxidoreductase [Pirellulales bacterium]